MKIKQIFFLVSFCLVILSGCNAKTTQTFEPKLTIPAPAEGKSVVYGRALNSKTSEPLKGTLFLARNLTYDQEGIPPTVSFSTQSDPSAVYDPETGEFYFKDIEPGLNYVIVLHNGPNDFSVVQDPETNTLLSVTIEEGQVINIGTLSLDEP